LEEGGNWFCLVGPRNAFGLKEQRREIAPRNLIFEFKSRFLIQRKRIQIKSFKYFQTEFEMDSQ
jgi:hypothetical protein